VFFMAQFLQTALHYSPLAAGLGLVLVAAGAAWLALAARSSLAYWQVFVPLLLTGLGFSAALPATQSAVMSHVAPQYIGKASSTFTMLRQLGGAFGIAVAAAGPPARGPTPPPSRSVTGTAPRSAATPHSRSPARSLASSPPPGQPPAHQPWPSPGPASWQQTEAGGHADAASCRK
jgi:hypothetical protein